MIAGWFQLREESKMPQEMILRNASKLFPLAMVLGKSPSPQQKQSRWIAARTPVGRRGAGLGRLAHPPKAQERPGVATPREHPPPPLSSAAVVCRPRGPQPALLVFDTASVTAVGDTHVQREGPSSTVRSSDPPSKHRGSADTHFWGLPRTGSLP